MKLKTEAISKNEFNQYLQNHSDFGFELRILHDLKKRGFHAEHGGHYDDPVTQKSREFDIRTISEYGNDMRVCLAIECKNIKPHFPLLVSTTPREQFESFISFISDSEFNKSPPDDSLLGQTKNMARIFEKTTQPCRHTMCELYKEGDFVGRSTAQIGKNSQGEIVSNDSEIYEKWGQAISSIKKVIEWLPRRDDGTLRNAPEILGCALPFVVVPDGMLWMVEYSEHGEVIKEPKQTDRIPCICGKKYEFGSTSSWHYRISHLEFVTQTGLLNFIDTYMKDEETVNKTFFASIDRLRDYGKSRG